MIVIVNALYPQYSSIGNISHFISNRIRKFNPLTITGHQINSSETRNVAISCIFFIRLTMHESTEEIGDKIYYTR